MKDTVQVLVGEDSPKSGKKLSMLSEEGQALQLHKYCQLIWEEKKQTEEKLCPF